MKIYPIAVLAMLGACQVTGQPDAIGINGTTSLSGEVSASAAFEAAQVYAKNIDKKMLYMVHTHDGHFRAINLLPGNYEEWVEKDGFEVSSATGVFLAAANSPVLNR